RDATLPVARARAADELIDRPGRSVCEAVFRPLSGQLTEARQRRVELVEVVEVDTLDAALRVQFGDARERNLEGSALARALQRDLPEEAAIAAPEVSEAVYDVRCEIDPDADVLLHPRIGAARGTDTRHG